jgi:hypothetical protein
LILPFIGGTKGDGNAFGYIFGSVGSDQTNYIPKTLNNVIIRDASACSQTAFRMAGLIRSVTIEKNLSKITGLMFYDTARLRDLVIPSDGVTSIENSSFNGCICLTNFVIPESVTSIGGLAFYDCRALPWISIPNSVTSI